GRVQGLEQEGWQEGRRGVGLPDRRRALGVRQEGGGDAEEEPRGQEVLSTWTRSILPSHPPPQPSRARGEGGFEALPPSGAGWGGGGGRGGEGRGGGGGGPADPAAGRRDVAIEGRPAPSRRAIRSPQGAEDVVDDRGLEFELGHVRGQAPLRVLVEVEVLD